MTQKQVFVMLYIFLISGSLAIGGGSSAGRYSWITPIFAILLAIPLMYVYFAPIKALENKNTFEINDALYGKFFGKVVNIFLFVSGIAITSISLSRFLIFIKTVALIKTPIYIIGIFMMFVLCYASVKGVMTLARFAEIMFVVIVVSIVFSFIISYNVIDFSQILPFDLDKMPKILSGIYTAFSMPFLECYFLVCLFVKAKDKKETPKALYLAVLVSAVTISLITLRNITILGYPAIQSLYYPSYLAVSLVSIGEFFQRQEVAVSIAFLMADIVKIGALLIYTIDSFSYVLKSQRKFSVLISVVVLLTSLLTFNNSLQLFRFFEIYKYVLIPPFLILPIITFILCKIKKKVV